MYDSKAVGSSASSYAVTATAFSLAFMAGSSSIALDEEFSQQQFTTDKSYVEQIAQSSYSWISEIEVVDQHKVDQEFFEASGQVFAKLSSQPNQLDPDVAAVVYDNFWDLCEA